MAKALVTGASSGIGRDLAKELSKRGYDIILVARNEEKLNEVASEIKTKVEVIPMDISVVDNCKKLYSMVEDVDILVNNAGFGVFGKFINTDLDREVKLIDTNVTAVHVLTKLFLKNMVERDKGYGVNKITNELEINEELKKNNSKVRVGTLNPGPVRTNFNKVANVKFDLKSLSSDYVARYTVDKILKGKTDITPGLSIKLLRFVAKISPTNLASKVVYMTQKRRE